MEYINNIVQVISQYWGDGAIEIMFLLSVLFFLLKKEKERNIKVYIYYVIYTLIIVLNPVSVYVIEKLGHFDVFERFFWLLLAPIFLAVCMSSFVREKKQYGIIFCILIIICGKIVFTETEYKVAENKYKISSEAIEVSDIIMRDFEGLDENALIEPNRQGIDAPYAMVTEPICEDIRMYNANIKLLFVRKDFGSYNARKYNAIASNLTLVNDEIKVKYIVKRMQRRKFDYLVLGNWQQLVGDVSAYPIKVIGKTNTYTVYKLTSSVTLREGQYAITQYADINGYQGMSYVIESYDGGLVVVDGGRAWQSLSLVDVIKEKGGKVDAWIITHGHDDHGGVLASILEAAWDKTEIEIGHIYIGEMDFEAVAKQGKRVDGYAYLLNGLKERDNVTYLKAGDELEILGLKMNVLHTCNDYVVQNSDNILNDGSMVFKLTGTKNSVLFLGDIGDNSSETNASYENGVYSRVVSNKIADEIIENYGELLPSTYVQVAHHGNNTLPDYFYEKINPKYAFIDAPDWLMNNTNMETGETSYYTNKNIVAVLKKMGTKIYSYSNTRTKRLK